MREFKKNDRIINITEAGKFFCVVKDVREDGNLIVNNKRICKSGSWIADPNKCYHINAEEEISFEQLTPEELEQCRNTYRGYLQEWANDDDSWDWHLDRSDSEIDDCLQACRLFRNLNDGYVFVSV